MTPSSATGRLSPLTEAPRFAALVKEKTGLDARIFPKREDSGTTPVRTRSTTRSPCPARQAHGQDPRDRRDRCRPARRGHRHRAPMLGPAPHLAWAEIDARRQALNVHPMRMLGAEVVEVTATRSWKDAINEALRDWVTNVMTRTTRSAPSRVHTVPGHGARLPEDHRRGSHSSSRTGTASTIRTRSALVAAAPTPSACERLPTTSVNLLRLAGGNGPGIRQHAIRFAPHRPARGMFRCTKSYPLKRRRPDARHLLISAGLRPRSAGP